MLYDELQIATPALAFMTALLLQILLLLAVFSEIVSSAPRFKLTYTKVDDRSLKLKFEIAPPGKPEAFSKYIEADLQRVK